MKKGFSLFYTKAIKIIGLNDWFHLDSVLSKKHCIAWIALKRWEMEFLTAGVISAYVSICPSGWKIGSQPKAVVGPRASTMRPYTDWSYATLLATNQFIKQELMIQNTCKQYKEMWLFHRQTLIIVTQLFLHILEVLVTQQMTSSVMVNVACSNL